MMDIDIARATELERLGEANSPQVRFRREYFAYQRIDRLREQLAEVRQSLKVAQAQ